MNCQPNPIVLMVDDDEDDRPIARDAFAESGIPGRFVSLGEGTKLMDYLSEHQTPAVILMDIRMRLLEEFEILKKLKDSPTYRDIPIVMLSTFRGKEKRAKSIEFGADAYFTKPPRFWEWVNIMKFISARWLSSPESTCLPELT